MKNSRKFTLSTTQALGASTLGAIGIAAWLVSRGISIPSAVVTSFSAAIVLGGMLVLGIRQPLEDLQKALIRKPAGIFLILVALWGLYCVYSLGTGRTAVQPLAVMAVYLSVPFLLLNSGRDQSRGTWLDAVSILWIWLPIEFGIVRRLLVTGDNTGFQSAFVQGLAVTMGVIAFAAWRRLPRIGYRFELTWKDVAAALFGFLLFAVIAIPLGLAIRFIQYSFEFSKLLFAPAAFLGIFVSIAIPEELLFRGLIQNWFERISGSRYAGLIAASIVFGAAHLNNGAMIPNYKYFLMASIAAVFYGLVWQRTGSIMAAAITHALVDTAWRTAFR